MIRIYTYVSNSFTLSLSLPTTSLSLLYRHMSTLLYTRNHNIDLQTSMNERTNLFLKIYLSQFILERVDVSVVCERGAERYIQREDFFSYLLPGARGCQRLRSLARSSETPLIGCVFLAGL